MSEETQNDKSWFEGMKDGLKEQIEIAKTIGAVGQIGVTMASGIAMEKPNVEIEQQCPVSIVQQDENSELVDQLQEVDENRKEREKDEREEELEKSAFAGNQPTISGPPNANSLTQTEEQESSEEDYNLPIWTAVTMAKEIDVELQEETPSEVEYQEQSEVEFEEEFEEQSQ